MDDHFTKAEAAARMRVSEKTVDRMIRAGQLSAVQTSPRGRVLIPRAEVERRLEPVRK